MKYAFFLFILIAGCGNTLSDSKTNQNILIEEKDINKKIILNKNKTVTIQLYENIGTGYTWIINDQKNIHIVEKMDAEISSKIENGGQKLRVWEITSSNPGSYKLIFNYKRSWEDIFLKKIEFDFVFF